MKTAETIVADAPGRLDFLGGVADYSGALVLQTPIAARTRVTLEPTRDGQLRVESDTRKPAVFSLDQWSEIEELDHVRDVLVEASVPVWSFYVYGSLAALQVRTRRALESGFLCRVTSEVPEGMGVSSSAALEIAALRAFNEFLGTGLSDRELAPLGQQAENRVVGSPCGIVDQLASACGKRGELLPVLCRPDEVLTALALPEEVTVVGWPSQVPHAASGSPYRVARTAAFMGKLILESILGRGYSYATEIARDDFRANVEELPESITGQEFEARFDRVDDPLSIIEDAVTYPVRAAFSYPLESHYRNLHLCARLADPSHQTSRVLAEIGTAMYEGHAGYSAMGLGTPETDAIVAAVREAGADAGFHGARVSCGGAGGTIVVLLDQTALPELESLVAADARRRSLKPTALIR